MTNEVLTQAILETLQKRANEKGDVFDLKGNQVRVRCFEPQSHKNGDAHPSAQYQLGKYIFCGVCGFKAGEKKLADLLGIGAVELGLTLLTLATAKGLPVDFLQKWGWRTQSGKDGQAKVLIPCYGKEGVTKHAPTYHLRHYINKEDDTGPRFTWDKPKGIELLPYGIWLFKDYQDNARSLNIEPYIFINESETDGEPAGCIRFPHPLLVAPTVGETTGLNISSDSRK